MGVCCVLHGLTDHGEAGTVSDFYRRIAVAVFIPHTSVECNILVKISVLCVIVVTDFEHIGSNVFFLDKCDLIHKKEGVAVNAKSSGQGIGAGLDVDFVGNGCGCVNICVVKGALDGIVYSVVFYILSGNFLYIIAIFH